MVRWDNCILPPSAQLSSLHKFTRACPRARAHPHTPHTTHISYTNASATPYRHHTQTWNIHTEGHIHTCTARTHTHTHTHHAHAHTPHHTHTQERVPFYGLCVFLSHMIINTKNASTLSFYWNIVDLQHCVSFRCSAFTWMLCIHCRWFSIFCRLYIIQQVLCLIHHWSLWPPDTQLCMTG